MINYILIALLAQSPATLRVTDPWDLPVAGANVTIESTRIVSSEAGEVTLPNNVPEEFLVEIESPGFEIVRKSFRRWSGVQVVQLHLASVMDRITVTATRSEKLAGETASSVTVIDSETLRTTPSRAVDDALRQVPGFSLLRRTSSVAAHPTSQGVSLRGVGASGASRTLVLADAIPLNDPFGSWVYWNRVPKFSIDTIEIVRGGASDLYGSQALGGVIHLRKRRPQRRSLFAEAFYGERGTGQSSVYASDVLGPWGYSVAAEAFRTDGYIAVAPAERGTVDRHVSVAYRTADCLLERHFSSGARMYANLAISSEDRENGTPIQENDTDFRQLTFGGEWTHPHGRSEYRIYAGSQTFDSDFSAIATNRAAESLTAVQRVPLGYGGVQGHTLVTFGRHVVVTGLEFRHVRGISNEWSYRTGVFSGRSRNGGSQQTFAAFLEDVVTINPRFDVTWSLRWDRWHNEDVAGTESIESSWSPKLAASWRFHPNWVARAAGYGAFRAPTLNELYRPFRVGNVLTLANPSLGDERLRGFEAGLQTQAFSGRVNIRGSGYWSEIEGTVANITLSSTPQLITRQRRNLGTVRSRGLELEVELRPHRLWSVFSGYLFSDSTVVRFPTSPVLEGLRLPQTPRHQFSISTQGSFARHYRVHVQSRASGHQFDDDRNTFRLGPFLLFDAYVSRAVGPNLEVFFAGENFTNREYAVGKTPVTTLGSPRTVRVGLTLRLGEELRARN